MTDERATIAACNNADLYERVFQAHELSYRREAYGFIGIDPAPPFYSDITTTSPHHQQEQRAAIDAHRERTGKGFCFKDSFCNHDMAAVGMEILFEACWLWAPAGTFAAETEGQWRRVETGMELAAWEEAWKNGGSAAPQRMFPARMLEMQDVAFFGSGDGNDFSAGCIANLSGGCVGLSNIFTTGDIRSACLQAARCAAVFAPESAIVAYDSGDMLAAMQDIGFENTGPLRIWIDRHQA